MKKIQMTGTSEELAQACLALREARVSPEVIEVTETDAGFTLTLGLRR